MSDFESRARKAADAVRTQIDGAPTDEERNLRRAKRHTNSRVVLPSTLLVVLIIGGGLFAVNRGGSSPTHNGPAGSPFELAGALQPFSACDDALQYFKDEAPQYYIAQTQNGGGGITPLAGGFDGPGPNNGPITTTTAPNGQQNASNQATAPNTADAAPNSNAAPSTGTPTTAPQFSTTNVQEVGVDEPDTIKTDGNTVVTVNAGSVYVLAANDGNPSVKAKLDVSGISNVLLSGTHLLLFSPGNGSQTVVTTFDISDPSHPVEIGALQMDGKLIDARMVGTQVRVATSFTPQPDIASPTYDNNGNPSKQSINALPGEVAATTLQDWVPRYSQLDGNGATVKSGQLVQCSDIAHPATFSGLNTIAMTVFDAGAAPAPTHSVGVVASDGSQMYATANNTYISSTDWQKDGSSPTSTDVHEFTTATNGVSTYVGSGSVDGTLLSSYSMSEDNGVLRVATTVSGSRGWINPREVSGGDVTTLRINNNKLVQVGKLTGLGQRDNEAITAVRFAGNRAYISTARQTDPFFVVDLSDPANPKLGGQLQVPGQSSYLEPLSNNLILSVGQSVASDGGVVPVPNPEPYAPTTYGAPPYYPNAQGPVFDTSTTIPDLTSPGIVRPAESQVQYTLYDVSNPSTPKKVGQLTYGAGQAGAAFDPHAFLYWQPRNLVISPATVYNIDGLQQFSGLLLMQADGTTLKEIGRLADTEYNGTFNGFQVTRSIVIGNDVYLLSNDNLQVDSLDSHAQVANVSLPG